MNIIIIICKAEGELDSESLVGHLAITDGAQSIRIRHTYIESWFDALIRGLQSIPVRSPSVIDLVDEPIPLVFATKGQELHISYDDVTVNGGTVESFTLALHSAAALFLDMVRTDIGDVASEILEAIGRFISNPEA